MKQYLVVISAMLIGLASSASRADFVINNTTLPSAKSNLSPLPSGADPTQYFQATDYNALMQAELDIRNALIAGNLFGFTNSASRPTLPSAASTFLWKRTADKHLLFYNGSSDVDLSASSSTRTRARVVAANTQYNFTANNTYLIPFYVPSDVTTVRIRMNNREMTTGTYGATITGVNVAIGTHNGSYGFTGSPAAVLSSVTVPGGADWVSAWIPVTRGTDGKVLLVYGVPGNQGSYFYEGAYNGKVSAGTTTVNPPPTSLTDSGNATFTVYLEYDSSRPRYIVLGDSISRGSHAEIPGFLQSAYYNMGIAKDLAMDVAGSGGLAAATLVGSSYLIDEEQFAGATIIIALGINDILGQAQSLTSYGSNISGLIQRAKVLGCTKVWLTTVSSLGQTSTAPSEIVRQLANPWIKSVPFQADGVIDLDSVLWDPANHTNLNPSYNTGDGVHPNLTGHAAMQSALTSALGL